MRWLNVTVLGICKLLFAVSCATLVIMMLLTVFDVILRTLGRPITGAYELIGYLSVIAVGFSLPWATWTKGHVFMEFIIVKIRIQFRNVADIFTRVVGMGLFTVATYSLVEVGMDFYRTGEGSPTLQIPMYPFAWSAALSSFMMCFVLLCDLLGIFGGAYDK
jgi:TRAP-type C4-dicarboxylate transport system permease small subunit